MIEADIGFVGEITRVNPTILNTLVKENYIPVVATIATDSESGQALNINADTAAGEVSQSHIPTCNALILRPLPAQTLGRLGWEGLGGVQRGMAHRGQYQEPNHAFFCILQAADPQSQPRTPVPRGRLCKRQLARVDACLGMIQDQPCQTLQQLCLQCLAS